MAGRSAAEHRSRIIPADAPSAWKSRFDAAASETVE
jgi:hypothetical protein